MSKQTQFAFAQAVSKKSKFINWKNCQELMQSFTQTIYTAITSADEMPTLEAFDMIVQETINQVYIKKTKPVAEDKPKKALTNFMAYCMEQRPHMKETHPELKSKEINSLLGKMWGELTQEEKDKYKGEPKKDSKKKAKSSSSKSSKKEESVEEKEAPKPKKEKVKKETKEKQPIKYTKQADKTFTSAIRQAYHQHMSEKANGTKAILSAFPCKLPSGAHFKEIWDALSNMTDLQKEMFKDSGLFEEEAEETFEHESWSTEVNIVQYEFIDIITKYFENHAKDQTLAPTLQIAYQHLVSLGYKGPSMEEIIA
jgi:hypothetical protein